MPALKNVKHEKFAQELARGKSATEAHKLAGYATNRGNATTLKQKKSVQKRVTELLNKANDIETKATVKAIEKLAVTKEAIIAELVKIGFCDIRKAVKWGEAMAIPDRDGNLVVTNGIALVASTDMDPDTAAAISEISQSSTGSLRIKFYDKKSALVDLGKHMGMFIDRTEVGAPGDFDHLTEAELDEQIARDAAALGMMDDDLADGRTVN